MTKVNDPVEMIKKNEFLDKWKAEWKIFFFALTRPYFLLLIFFVCLAIYFSNMEGTGKTIAIFLQIVATIMAGFAANIFYDVIKQAFEKSTLTKKGISAVRNLSLTRLKTKNIVERVSKVAISDEIINLLLLLEKDIANATQEWNDILPGVSDVQEFIFLLSDKEKDLSVLKKEKEELEKHLQQQKQLTEEQKKELSKGLADKEIRIQELRTQIEKLKPATFGTNVLGGLTTTSGATLLYPFICKKCGAGHASVSLTGENLCPTCRMFSY